MGESTATETDPMVGRSPMKRDWIYGWVDARLEVL
jgi:hypothetical protein